MNKADQLLRRATKLLIAAEASSDALEQYITPIVAAMGRPFGQGVGYHFAEDQGKDGIRVHVYTHYHGCDRDEWHFDIPRWVLDAKDPVAAGKQWSDQEDEEEKRRKANQKAAEIAELERQLARLRGEQK